MSSTPLISPHDPVARSVRPCAARQADAVVPRENEAINETWIADRDASATRA